MDFSDDWQVIDDLISVSYLVKTAEGTYNEAVSVPNVFQEPIALDYEKVELEVSGTHFNFWANQLSSIVPNIDDKFTDEFSTTWVIKEVEYLDLDAEGYQRFRAKCVAAV